MLLPILNQVITGVQPAGWLATSQVPRTLFNYECKKVGLAV